MRRGKFFSKIFIRLFLAHTVIFTFFLNTITPPQAHASTSWETAVLKGMADFMIERAQGEAVYWMLGTVLEKVCKDNGNDQYGKLFKRSCYLHKEFRYAPTVSFNTLVKALHDDLIATPFVLANINEEDMEWVEPFVNILLKLRKGEDIKTAIEISGALDIPCNENKQISCSVRLSAKLLTGSIAASDAENTINHINTLFKGKQDEIRKALNGITNEAIIEAIKKELETIETAIKNISNEITLKQNNFKNNVTNNVTNLNTAIEQIMKVVRDSKDDIEILEKLKQPQTDFKNAVEEISKSLDFLIPTAYIDELTKSIDNVTDLLKNLKNDENKNKEIIEALNKTKNGVLTVNNLAIKLHGIAKKQIPTIADKVNSLTYAFVELKIYNNRKANEKSDSEVLAKAFNVTERLVSVIDTFMPNGDTKFDVAILAMKSGAAITAGDYPEGLLLLSEALNKLPHKECGHDATNKDCTRRQQIISILRPAMPLLTDLASADSPEQVKSIFNDAASPIGAWKLKRVNRLVSIGGIVGVGIGYEKLNATEDKGDFTANSASVFAPVGIDFSWPIKDFRNGVTAPKSSDGSLGVFLSVIDLGNLVSQRYAEKGESGAISGESNATFPQVLSPGFYLKWGIGNSPLVTGVGVSYNPQIRDVNISDVNNRPTDAVVYRAYIGIDIVMFLTDLLSK